MKIGTCEKCKGNHYLVKHHFFPIVIFGKNKYIAYICDNCHREYHIFLGNKNLRNDSIIFHLNKWIEWFSPVLIIGAIAGIYYLI